MKNLGFSLKLPRNSIVQVMKVKQVKKKNKKKILQEVSSNPAIDKNAHDKSDNILNESEE
jgi:hypothetical protein